MNQEETSETIKETFNVSLNESEILPKEKPGKLKYTIAIISTLVLLAAATTLLIGYFKFNWFQSEIYKVDINVVRNLNQANYFTETKKITTKVALTEEG